MNRPRRAAKKPTGPEISAAECADQRRKIMEDASKRFSRAEGIRAIQEFISRQIAAGVLDVTFKQLSLITKKRIVDPARGVNCSHLECFDLSAYFGKQIDKPFWDCPICQKPLPAENLRIDELTFYMLRVELDSVLSVEVYGDGSHRAVKSSTADVITLDDGPLVEDDKEEESPEIDPLVTLPLSLLVDCSRQTKELLGRMPIRKGERKADDPADLLEEHLDSLKSLIKEAKSQAEAAATCDVEIKSTSSELVQGQELVMSNEGIRAQNEEIAGRNSALLAESLRLNRRVAELEQDLSNGRPKLRFIAHTSKNTTEVLVWLDRFSLDAVQLTSMLLRTIVDAYLPAAPMRVLKKICHWRNPSGTYMTTLDAKCPARCLTPELCHHRRWAVGMDPEDVFRYMFVLCAGCSIEGFEITTDAWTPTVRGIFAEKLPSVSVRKAEFYCSIGMSTALIKMMRGLESVYIGASADATTDETMKACAERGVASLGIGDTLSKSKSAASASVTDEALLDFCFSNVSTNGGAEGRVLMMSFCRPTEIFLSKLFFGKFVKKCLDQAPKALPTVTLDCAVDTTAYDWMAKTHESHEFKCTHFQFDSGEKFEIVVRKWRTDFWTGDCFPEEDNWCWCHFIVRKGHVDFQKCPEPQSLCDWSKKEFGI